VLVPLCQEHSPFRSSVQAQPLIQLAFPLSVGHRPPALQGGAGRLRRLAARGASKAENGSTLVFKVTTLDGDG
jgi:hypothetical protein